MADDPSTSDALRRMGRTARTTEARARLAAALDAMVGQAVVAFVVLAATLTIAKVAPWGSARWARIVLAGALGSILVAGAVAAARRLPPLLGAMLLDRAHGLEGRIANAISFARTPFERRTPLMQIAVEDGCARARGLSPRRALPIPVPRDWAAALGLGAMTLLVAAFEVRTHRPVATARSIDPVVLGADDIELFREVGRTLTERAADPELVALALEYNQLVDDLARRRLDRAEAFRRMSDLESRIASGRALDPKKLEEQLKERARALKRSGLTRPAAEALETQDFAKAEEQLRALANKIAKGDRTQRNAELERLREAMKKAAEGRDERVGALETRREQLREEQLLRKSRQGDAGAPDAEEQRLLERRDRELERLDRDLEDEQRAARKLERLDRDLEQAAEDILRDLGIAAKDLEQAAEDVNRFAREKMTDEEREELRQRLEDLREQLRQAGQNGGSRAGQLRRFARLARGERGQGQGQGQGQGEGKEAGEGKDGQGQGDQGETWVIGPGGEKILTISRGGMRSSSGEGRGSEGERSGADGHEQGGKDWGTGHDPNLAGEKATNPKMGTMDVQAAGLETGQGATRSQAILGAGERGFRGSAYKRVFSEYRTTAEQHIHKDRIPPGANERIRRYFDLIRPRD